MPQSQLALKDIADLRAYEAERIGFRSRIIDLKRLRRIPVGDFVTLIFENRETVRFQVQEMARAERMLRDEQIQIELDTYNVLVPKPGELVATMFIELTSKAELERWLPKLVGIESSALLEGEGARIRATVDPTHADQLSRSDVTASVHYVKFAVPESLRAGFASGGWTLAIDHPEYQAKAELSAEFCASIASDWA